jgi:hypothetical protein
MQTAMDLGDSGGPLGGTQDRSRGRKRATPSPNAATPTSAAIPTFREVLIQRCATV